MVRTLRLVFIFWMLLTLQISSRGVSAYTSIDEEPPVSSSIANPSLMSSNSANFAGCGGTTVPVVNTTYEREVVYLVNQERAKAGLPPLKRSIELEEASRYHAADLAQDNYFEHDSYDRVGEQLVYVCSTWDRIQKYYPSPSAENIAGGYATPSSVMNGWMTSSGHRNNILGAYSWEIGVGYYQGGSYGSYWVQDFGRRPGVYPLIINQDAENTDTRSVSLYIYGDWAEVRLRNDDDTWSSWFPFQNHLNWELGGGVGTHTVWAELRTASDSTLTSDTINLTEDDFPRSDTPTPTATLVPGDPPNPTQTPVAITYSEFVFLPQILNVRP